MALVTYEMAVRHLKQTGVLDGGSPVDEDADVLLKMEQASQIVVTVLKREGTWDATTDPSDAEFSHAQAMTLKVLGHLYRFRGDDIDEPALMERIEQWGVFITRMPTLA